MAEEEQFFDHFHKLPHQSAAVHGMPEQGFALIGKPAPVHGIGQGRQQGFRQTTGQQITFGSLKKQRGQRAEARADVAPAAQGVRAGATGGRFVQGRMQIVAGRAGQAGLPAPEPGGTLEKQIMFHSQLQQGAQPAQGRTQNLAGIGGPGGRIRLLPGHIPGGNHHGFGPQTGKLMQEMGKPEISVGAVRGFQMRIAEHIAPRAAGSRQGHGLPVHKARGQIHAVQIPPCLEDMRRHTPQGQIRQPEISIRRPVGCQHPHGIFRARSKAAGPPYRQRRPDIARTPRGRHQTGGGFVLAGGRHMAAQMPGNKMLQTFGIPGPGPRTQAQPVAVTQGQPRAAAKAQIGPALGHMPPDGLHAAPSQPGGLEAGIAAGHEQQRKTPLAPARIARLAEQAAFGYVLGLEQTAGQAKAAHGAPGHESPDMGRIP